MANKKKKAAPRKAATKAIKPWTNYEVEMLLNTGVLLKTLPWVIGYIVIALEVRVLFFRRDRHKNIMKDSSIVVWGTVSSACGLASAVSYFWLYRFRSRKKQRVNGLYPFLDSLRTVPFFYPFPYKTCAYKRSNFVGTGTHFNPSRSASFALTCKRALSTGYNAEKSCFIGGAKFLDCLRLDCLENYGTFTSREVNNAYIHLLTVQWTRNFFRFVLFL